MIMTGAMSSLSIPRARQGVKMNKELLGLKEE